MYRITALKEVILQAYVFFIKDAKRKDGETVKLDATLALQTLHMRQEEVREDVAMILSYSIVTYNGFAKDGRPIETHSDFRAVDLRGGTHGVIDDDLLVEPSDYFRDRLP